MPHSTASRHGLPLALCLLLQCAVPLASASAIYRCTENGVATYSDRSCADARPFTPAPLPTIPALPSAAPRASGNHASGNHAAGKRAAGKPPAPPAESAHKKKCDKLALQRRWAAEDLQAAGARPLLPQDGKADLARRKLRRLDEQHRQECAGAF